MQVEITKQEQSYCFEVADSIDRNISRDYSRHKMGTGGDRTSCVAQYGFSKLLGKEWKPTIVSKDFSVDVKKGESLAGVISGCRLRTITNAKHNLLIRTNDEDNLNAVLCLIEDCLVENFTVRFLGWINIGEAKTNFPLRTDIPYPAHFVPQRALRPMSELIERLKNG